MQFNTLRILQTEKASKKTFILNILNNTSSKSAVKVAIYLPYSILLS